MRATFSNLLVEAVTKNPSVYLLTGDHGYALFDQLRKSVPEHFINCGVAEQNMVGVAAGLSKLGFLPIVYGLSSFVPIRVLEQIKIDFCYEKLPGIFIGDGAGVVYSHLGSSHQSTEDIAVLRAIPNIQIYSPADKFEFAACFQAAMVAKAPVYIRMGKDDSLVIHESELKEISLPIQIEKYQSKMALIATGSMVSRARNVAIQLKNKVDVWSVPQIKPLNENRIRNLLGAYDELIVLEEHSTYGGLGSAFSEIFSSIQGPRIHRIGVPDQFSKYCGTYSYLMKTHGLDEESILTKVRGLL